MTKQSKRMNFDTLLTLHLDALHQRYGDMVAINIGWVSDERCVASKVYPRREIFSSCISKDGTVTHTIEMY